MSKEKWLLIENALTYFGSVKYLKEAVKWFNIEKKIEKWIIKLKIYYTQV